MVMIIAIDDGDIDDLWRPEVVEPRQGGRRFVQLFGARHKVGHHDDL